MTLLFVDGADAQDTLLKWASTLAAAPVYAVGRYLTGSAFRASTSSGRLTKAIPASAQIIVGGSFKCDSLAATRVLLAGYGDAGATQHATLQVSTTGQVQAARATTVLASSAPGLITAGAWNTIEMRATIADAGGVVEILVNGVQVVNFSGDTKNVGTATSFDMVSLGGPTNMDLNVWYDDLYILNTLGSAPRNTFLGEIQVRARAVDGAGASSGFTPIGSGTNWQNVEEFPPDGADYNHSDTVGARDLYTVADLPAGSPTILGVQVNLVAAKTSIGAGTLAPAVRSGGTVYLGSTLTLDPNAKTYSSIRETDPATATDWTVSGVNALEIGAEVV